MHGDSNYKFDKSKLEESGDSEAVTVLSVTKTKTLPLQCSMNVQGRSTVGNSTSTKSRRPFDFLEEPTKPNLQSHYKFEKVQSLNHSNSSSFFSGTGDFKV